MTALGRMPEAGFTLIETLVALAVLAITAMGLLAATEAHVARIAGLEMRAAAAWTAENHLADITLGLAPAREPAAMLGFRFSVTDRPEPTTDPDVLQHVITVQGAGLATGQIARLTGFSLTGISLANSSTVSP
jgi:general secretion pathway protein I